MSTKAKFKRTKAGDVFTDLVLEIFKLNGRLIAEGDSLTRELGLTSARWKVLGAINQQPLTASQIARTMGLTRQNVQQIVNFLVQSGFVELVENPDHQRAKLIRLSHRGRDILEKTTEKQFEWANRVSSRIGPDDLEAALKTIRKISDNLN